MELDHPWLNKVTPAKLASFFNIKGILNAYVRKVCNQMMASQSWHRSTNLQFIYYQMWPGMGENGWDYELNRHMNALKHD